MTGICVENLYMAPGGAWERLEATGSPRVASKRSLRVPDITIDDIPLAFCVVQA